jgi:two-component system, NarL family, sensor kinase
VSGGTTISLPAPPAAVPAGTSQRLACLLEVSQVINSSLELNAVLNHILSQAEVILQAEGGSIMLVDETTRSCRVVAAQGPRARDIQGKRQELGQGVAGWVALHGKPLLLHGPASDPRIERVCDRRDVRDALCVPLRAEGKVVGVISLNNRRSAQPFSEEDLELLTALSNQAALAIRNAASFREMRRQRRTVQRLLDEVTRAHEEERMRIALLLHDGPAQTLFAALRNLETLRALTAEGPADAGGVMGELERTIRHAITETRAVMMDLRPPGLEEMSLLPALRKHARQFEERSGIRTRVIYRGRERRLPGVVEASFYRIAQEALTNIWKHSEARQAKVVLEVEEHCCSLEIRDDGKGFDPATVASEAEQHLGMRSLRERAELVGGSFTVGCPPEGGTVVRVSAPFTE